MYERDHKARIFVKDGGEGKWTPIAISGRTYDLRQQDPNDFQQLLVQWADEEEYVLDYFKWHTPVYPVAESIKLHFNYTDWRDHFSSASSPSKGYWVPYGNYIEREPQIWPVKALVHFLPVSQYMLELASGARVLVCCVLTSREA